MITMDMAPDLVPAMQDRQCPAPQAPDNETLWAEHGWGLTGRQVAGILAVIGLACAALHLIG